MVFRDNCYQVWLTSDNEIVVVHGGYSGEINFRAEAHEQIGSGYVFEHTLLENRMLETQFRLPTLREVLFAANKNVFTFIEMKVPYDPVVKT